MRTRRRSKLHRHSVPPAVYFIDKDRVYYASDNGGCGSASVYPPAFHVVAGADPSSFVSFAGEEYGEDKNHVYGWGDVLSQFKPGLDPKQVGSFCNI